MSVEDYTRPILSGEGASDYERSRRTDELLGALVKQRFYPELWQARNRLTELANEEE